jgi:hypothetical protein
LWRSENEQVDRTFDSNARSLLSADLPMVCELQGAMV